MKYCISPDTIIFLFQSHSRQVKANSIGSAADKEEKKQMSKEKKFAKTMISITCLFFVTYFPVMVVKAVIKKSILQSF